jgi:hypothetical protein
MRRIEIKQSTLSLLACGYTTNAAGIAQELDESQLSSSF